jgi:periplasmic divalent cation tolerance protein
VEYLQVFISVKTKENAKKIGKAFSQYWWKGKIELSEEWLCLIKSRRTLYEELEQTVKQMHTYEVPEVIALPIIDGNTDYLEWLRKELKKKEA